VVLQKIKKDTNTDPICAIPTFKIGGEIFPDAGIQYSVRPDIFSVLISNFDIYFEQGSGFTLRYLQKEWEEE
jgi:hypothetical protein